MNFFPNIISELICIHVVKTKQFFFLIDARVFYFIDAYFYIPKQNFKKNTTYHYHLYFYIIILIVYSGHSYYQKKMTEQETACSTNTPRCSVISNPSKVIGHHRQLINIEDVSLELNLVTMKRSFLLSINNVDLDGFRDFGEQQIPLNSGGEEQVNVITRDDMIRGFMDSNSTMKGLSLAIGQHNTCLMNSDNSIASATLASRLSKKLNQNRPVYVANNFQFSNDTLELDSFMAKLYMKVFQFVRNNYKCE